MEHAGLSLLVIFLILGSTLLSIRKVGFIFHIHGVLVYLAFSVLVLFLTINGYLSYQYLNVWSTFQYESHYSEVLALYLGLACFYLLAIVGFRKISVTVSEIHIRNIPLVVVLIFTSLAYLVTCYHFLTLDYDVLLYNQEYLKIASVQGLSVSDSLSRFIHSSIRYRGIVFVAVAMVLLQQKKNGYFALFIPIIFYHVLFDLASHSRYAAIYFAETAVLYSILFRKYRVGVAVSCAGISLLMLAFALLGRTVNEHGITALLPDMSKMPDSITLAGYMISNVVPNFFEGAYVSSEIFGVEGSFPLKYKLLSFSPLPSFIDGFSGVLQMAQLRLHTYVPMSAFHEIYLFGWPYILCYFGVQYYAIRVSIREYIRRPSLINLAGMFLLFLAFVLQFTYPVRNVFRFFIYIFAIRVFGRIRIKRVST